MAATIRRSSQNSNVYEAYGIVSSDKVGRVKGIGVAPRFSRTPGKIWRGSVRLGHDNAKIYGELLGIGAAELQELARDGVI